VTTQPDPRLVEAAKNAPTLAYMINKGVPLTREAERKRRRGYTSSVDRKYVENILR